jgi:hypothetical protein
MNERKEIRKEIDNVADFISQAICGGIASLQSKYPDWDFKLLNVSKDDTMPHGYCVMVNGIKKAGVL